MLETLFGLMAFALLWLVLDKLLSMEIQLAEQMSDEGDDYLRGVHGN